MNNTAENQDTVEMGNDADVLVVVSKLKNYIRAQSGFNTAGTVAPAISLILRKLCDKAVENAKNDGRKTVMDRDFTALA